MLKKEKWKTGANPLDGNGVAGSVLHLMARKPSDVYHKNQLNMFQKFAHSSKFKKTWFEALYAFDLYNVVYPGAKMI